MKFRISLSRPRTSVSGACGQCFLSTSFKSKSRNMSSAQALLQDCIAPSPDIYQYPKKSRFQGKGIVPVSVHEIAPIEHGFEPESPSELTYTGGETFPITSLLHVVTPEEDTPSGTWPIFRLMVRNNDSLLVQVVFTIKLNSYLTNFPSRDFDERMKTEGCAILLTMATRTVCTSYRKAQNLKLNSTR
jgi:hypothetical protein